MEIITNLILTLEITK